MIALVFLLIFLATSFGSIHISFSSMSANIGVAPTCFITSTVLTHVYGTVITSSPGPTPRASSDKCSADVHELNATQLSVSQYSANCFSNFFTAGPLMKLLDFHVSANALVGFLSVFS